MAELGRPSHLTVVAHGLDLIVLADGPFGIEVLPSGGGRFRISGVALRCAFMPGIFRLTRGGYHNLRGLVFTGALLREAYGPLTSPGRERAAAIRRAKP